MVSALLTCLLAAFLLFIIVITINDYRKDRSYKPLPSSPPVPLTFDINKVLYDLGAGKQPDLTGIDGLYDFIEKRYDCSYFYVTSILRILYQFNDNIPQDVCGKFGSLLTGFRYWMDEPGEDSMCMWTENHQALFITSELLAGQLFDFSI
ncbi:MAG: hypothetical protein ACRCUT_06560 [Spirochaetota bacterium]